MDLSWDLEADWPKIRLCISPLLYYFHPICHYVLLLYMIGKLVTILLYETLKAWFIDGLTMKHCNSHLKS